MKAKRGWDFWIDRGGTFTDVIGRAPDGPAARAKAPVGERALRGRRGRGDPPPARPRARAKRSRKARSAPSRWARRSRPTRCSSGAASARCSSRRAASATRSRSATRRARRSSRSSIVKPEQLYAGVIEIDERVLADGTVEAAPDPDAVRAALDGGASGRIRRGRDRLHARLPLSGARAHGRRHRAQAPLPAGVREPSLLGADQARRARRHDGGRRLSVADPRPLRRARLARARRRSGRARRSCS